jgi:sorting nexin-17
MGAVIVLRKSYWDTTYDLELLNDPVALNLLYIQAAAEIRSEWILVTKEVQHHLENLQKSKNTKEVRLL